MARLAHCANQFTLVVSQEAMKRSLISWNEFLVFYLTCIAATWWFYTRTSFLASRAPSLAEANV